MSPIYDSLQKLKYLIIGSIRIFKRRFKIYSGHVIEKCSEFFINIYLTPLCIIYTLDSKIVLNRPEDFLKYGNFRLFKLL